MQPCYICGDLRARPKKADRGEIWLCSECHSKRSRAIKYGCNVDDLQSKVLSNENIAEAEYWLGVEDSRLGWADDILDRYLDQHGEPMPVDVFMRALNGCE